MKETAAEEPAKPISLPDGIEIYFGANLTAGQRELVEQSIAATVGRMRAEADAALARMAEENTLLDAINAPVAKLIRADPGAAEALEKFSARRVWAEDSLHPEDPPRGRHDHVIPELPTVRSDARTLIERRTPPYDFAWRWHHAGGASPFSQHGDPRGRLAVEVRSGPLVTGGADRVVHAHIGVGCIVRVDRPRPVYVSATRLSHYFVIIGAPGFGAIATSEGGLETTFMRGGQVQFAGTLPLWRRRLTSGEERFQREVLDRYPDGMGGLREPGEYAFNVGIYAVADHSSGIGGAGVLSRVQSNVLEMVMIQAD